MGEESAACCVLHDDGQVLVCQEAFLEADDMRVYQHGVIEQLPLHIFRHLPLKTVPCHEDIRCEETVMTTDMHSSALQHLSLAFHGYVGLWSSLPSSP